MKNTTYNGCHNGVWSPINYTTWVVEHVELPIGKMNTPLRKEFTLAPIKKIDTLVHPSTFADVLLLHAYHQIQKHCAYPNYDTIPNTSEIGKWFPMPISNFLGQLVWIVQTTMVLASNNTMIKLAKFEKCNSKFDRQLDIVHNDEYDLPFEQCKRSNCSLLVHVTLELIPKANPPIKTL